ncbi:MAG TPA: immunoglobulin domain-containing protein [Verrucomicrobiae bacterium]|jgi:hypothetical protein
MKTNSFAGSNNVGKPLRFCMAIMLAMAFPAVLAAQSLAIFDQPQSQSVWGGTDVSLSVTVTGNGETAILPRIDSGTLRLWLKADAGVVSNSAGLVSQWQDQSGNANHAFQSDSTHQPALVFPAGINGLAAIRFNGILGNVNFMQGSGDVGVSNAMTTFSVINAFTSTNYVNMAWLIGAPARFGFDRSEADYNGARAFTVWGDGFTSPFIIPTNTYRIWGDRIDTNLSTIELFDATLTGATNFSSAMPFAGAPAPGYFVGGLDPAVSSGWNFDGDIAEWIVYQGYLSEPDRLSVMNYLTQKYFQAEGPAPEYQWQFNGTNILGQTNSSLILPDIQSNQAGIYRVIVSNQSGSIFSSNAVVDVKLTPVIVSQPADQHVFTGETASFSVGAIGPVPLQYQWTFDGTNLPGATDSSLIISNAQPSNAGTYSVILGTAPNLTTSSNVVLSIYPLNVVSTNLDEDSLLIAMQAGGTVTFATNGVLMVSNTITISNDVVLDGIGHSVTISGNVSGPLFSVSPGVNFTLRNLTMANATNYGPPLVIPPGITLGVTGAAYGGAIFNQGDVTTANCVFSNIMAQGGGSIYREVSGSPAAGGAIYNLGFLAVSNSFFEGNSANGGGSFQSGSGGAIFNDGGTLVLDTVSFFHNTAIGSAPAAVQRGDYLGGPGGDSSGGAISSSGGNISAWNITVVSNSALGQGAQVTATIPGGVYDDGQAGDAYAGALYVGGGNVTISNSVISNNLAVGGSSGNDSAGQGQGGGIYNAGSTFLIQCDIIGNIAQGGIIDGSWEAFGNSSPGSGGGVYNAGNIQIFDSLLSSNVAIGGAGGIGTPQPGAGGAIYNSGTLLVSETTLAENLAVGGGEAGSEGAGIANVGTAQLEISVLVDNKALNAPDLGDGIYNAGNLATDTNTYIQTSVSEGAPGTYSWQINGAAITNAELSSFSLTSINFGITEIASLFSASPSNSVALNEIVNLAPSNAPVFAMQPMSKSVTIGDSAELAAVAISTQAPTYQWKLNGTNVAGATSNVLTLSEVQLKQTGTYTVIASNSYGSSVSQPAVLTVHGIGLTTFNEGNGVCVVNTAGASMNNFILEFSTDLINWRPMATNLPQQSFLITNVLTVPFQFFRAVAVP